MCFALWISTSCGSFVAFVRMAAGFLVRRCLVCSKQDSMKSWRTTPSALLARFLLTKGFKGYRVANLVRCGASRHLPRQVKRVAGAKW
jgi:hypothetical protein